MNNPRLRFTKIRNVKIPVREYNSAGYDFFVPEDLVLDNLMYLNPRLSGFNFLCDSEDHIEVIRLYPGERINIPSGIKALIEPVDSMLQVNNKSGVSTKKGLLFTANIIDSDYTGEIHLGVFNSGTEPVEISAGSKLVQLIHVPIYTPEIEEIPGEVYDRVAENWGNRGSNGFGSSDNGTSLDDEINLRSY